MAFDNTDLVRRTSYRLDAYRKITCAAVRNGASLPLILASRMPFRVADTKKPSLLNIELTDACNLKCRYCNNPNFANPRTYMKDDVFDGLIRCLKEFRMDRILMGGGEPTLHPKFAQYSKRTKSLTPFLGIVTNAQWKKPETAISLIENYDLVEVSVDAGGKENYEFSRVGGNYERLFENLELLKQVKTEMKSNALINIRYMIRPSTDEDKYRELKVWKQFADCVMPQYIVQHMDTEHDDDVFHSVHVDNNLFPRCTLPFRNMQVRCNGNIPLCPVNASNLDPAKRELLGNVRTDSLKKVWQGQEFNRLRAAHRNRINQDMAMCRGCRGC